MQKQVWEQTYQDELPGSTEDVENAMHQAYKLCRYQLEYSYLLYDFSKGESMPTPVVWDGATHVLYMVSW